MPVIVHKHEWEPVLRWIGRYRCAGCGAFGYKMRAVMHFGKPGIILAYRCSVKGCRRIAVTKEPRKGKENFRGVKYWKCPLHRVSKPGIMGQKGEGHG